MWAVVWSAKESALVGAESYGTREEAEAAFLACYAEARDENTLLDFWMDKGGNGVLETRHDLTYLAEAVPAPIGGAL